MTRKTGSESRKVTLARDDWHQLRMAVNDRTASSRWLATHCLTATCALVSVRQFDDVCCIVDFVQVWVYTRFLLRQTIYGCDCNELIITDPGKLIGTKFSFQMNHASICGTMVITFVLDAMSVNAALQIALLKDIIAEHSTLWSPRTPVTSVLQVSPMLDTTTVPSCNQVFILTLF